MSYSYEDLERDLAIGHELHFKYVGKQYSISNKAGWYLSEQAYKQGESTVKQSEHSYFNGYGEQVEWKFIMVLDVFELLDDVIKSGVEVYSRFIHSTKYISTDDVIQQYYPESIVKDNE
ncbi:DUF4288 domain-containing protein [Paenibacillus sp. N3.4]|uniref:DUF4288 domain-containing protein n=1 Tax=Paenibacillus sp. N3.4 TaxID=2603222 RepID=UPI0016500D11|nr:DUF4288 domain-containing protein [Paenibacillus sp. N3.4]